MEIRKFEKKFAEELAEHLNQSKDGWPAGGIKSGIEFDGRTIQEWLEKNDPQIFLAMEKSKIAGMLSCFLQSEKNKTGYINLVNVHPDFQGKGVGKALLRACLEEVFKSGLNRIDLHTWTANRKALPLYNKMGFIQKPGEGAFSKPAGVYMVNFLPLIMQNSLLGDLISEKGWYGFFKAEISPEGYYYRWEWEDDCLEVVIDHVFERIKSFSGADLKAAFSLEKGKVSDGDTSVLRGKIERKEGEKPLTLSFFGDGDCFPSGNQIKVDKTWELEKNILFPKINPGEKKQKRKFSVNILLGEKQVLMGVGKEIKPTLDIILKNDLPELIAGEEKEISFKAKNNLGERFSGKIKTFCKKGISDQIQEFPVEIAPGAFKEIRLFLKGEKEGKGLLEIRAVGKCFEVIKKQDFLIRDPGNTGEGKINGTPWVINDQVAITAEGSWVKGYDKSIGRWVFKTEAWQAGPPYNNSLFREKEFLYDLDKGNLLLIQEDPGEQGLKTEYRFKLSGNRVYSDVKVINRDNENKKIRFQSRNGFSGKDFSRVVFPIDGGVIAEDFDAQNFPGRGDLVFSSLPWLAWESDERVVGIIPGGKLEKAQIRDNSLDFFHEPFYLGENLSRVLTGPEFFAGRGSWEELIEKEKPDWKKQKVFSLGEPFWETGFPVLVYGVGEGVISGFYPAKRPCLLQLKVDFEKEFEFSSFLKEKEGYSFPLEWKRCNLKPGFYSAKINFSLRGREREKELPLVVLGERKKENPVQGKGRWELSSGFFKGEIDPLFACSVYKLQYKGIEILNSPYPEAGDYYWTYPWFGGIHPLIFTGEDDFYPGNLNREKNVEGKKRKISCQGLDWEGFEYFIQPRQENFKGLKVKVQYFTIPGIPSLFCGLRIKNSNDYRVFARSGFYIFLNPEFLTRGSQVQLKKGEEIIRRKTGVVESQQNNLDWVAIQGKEKLIITGDENSRVNFWEMPPPGDSYLTVGTNDFNEIEPGEEFCIKAFLFPGEGLEKGDFLHEFVKNYLAF